MGQASPFRQPERFERLAGTLAAQRALEAGRRLNGWAREVVPVRTAYVADLTEEQKQHLSTTADATTLYIRITDKGRFRLHPDWTPSA